MIEGVEALEAVQRIQSAVCQLGLGTPGRIVLYAPADNASFAHPI